jgi:hypothetical protein
MNFVWAPDNEWDYIANLTGDETWGHEHMRRHLMDLENCTYVPHGTPGHGFDGYLVVRHNSASSPCALHSNQSLRHVVPPISSRGSNWVRTDCRDDAVAFPRSRRP